MSRSYRKNPILGMTTSSVQKQFKQSEHRAERRIVKICLTVEAYEQIPHPKEYGNEWSSPRDSKQYMTSPEALHKYMRK